MKKFESTKRKVNSLIGRNLKRKIESVFFEFDINEELYYNFCEAVGFEIVHPSTQENLILSTTRNATNEYNKDSGDLFDKNKRFVAAIIDGMEQCTEFLITVKSAESTVFYFDIFKSNYIKWAETHDENSKVTISYIGHQTKYASYRNNCRLLMLNKIATRRHLEMLGVIPSIKDTIANQEHAINV